MKETNQNLTVPVTVIFLLNFFSVCFLDGELKKIATFVFIETLVHTKLTNGC